MNKSNVSLTLQQQVSEVIEAQHPDLFGFTNLNQTFNVEFYRNWIDNGFHGSMDYLARHIPYKENPELLLKNVKSAIVVAYNYIPHPKPLTSRSETHSLNTASAAFVPHSLRIARYAKGEDYHHWLKDKLSFIIKDLLLKFPDESFLAATDSSPVLERDLAYRAGIGWVGKNACLINQRAGSFFLLGEILTTLDLQAVKPLHPDRCGTCTRCIDACPTEAILQGRQIDSRKCISYLTIESKTLPPENLREQIGDNFFGCDICQTVCPWNEKAFGLEVKQDQEVLTPIKDSNHRIQIISELKWVLESSNSALEKHVKATGLSRARSTQLKRNAILVATNSNFFELKETIEKYTTDPRLGELAVWSLKSFEGLKFK